MAVNRHNFFCSSPTLFMFRLVRVRAHARVRACVCVCEPDPFTVCAVEEHDDNQI